MTDVLEFPAGGTDRKPKRKRPKARKPGGGTLAALYDEVCELSGFARGIDMAVTGLSEITGAAGDTASLHSLIDVLVEKLEGVCAAIDEIRAERDDQ